MAQKTTLGEIRQSYNLLDLLNINEALDLVIRQERKAMERSSK
jgi:ABC-type lipoprotein export system ATPase subunit